MSKSALHRVRFSERKVSSSKDVRIRESRVLFDAQQ